jgi:hypothetical protein
MKSVAVTQCYCCTQKFNNYHKAKFWFVYSQYTQKCYYCVDHPSSFQQSVTLWLQRLAYLADILTTISEQNLSFQGVTMTVILAREKTESFLQNRILEDMH